MKIRSRFIGVLVFLKISCGAFADEKPPNIIVILTDDMGWSDIGAFGSEANTPNIDKLAKDGVKFTQFYNGSRCCPSRASLLTGLYPHQAGVGHMLRNDGKNPGYSEGLTSNSVTIAQVLKNAGYGTYMTGKWHLTRYVEANGDKSGWPLQKGFDKFYGILSGYGSLFDPNTLTRQNQAITPENDPEYKNDKYYFTDAITDNSIKYIQDHIKEKPENPFFLYVAYTAAHWPLHAPEEEIDKYKGKYSGGYNKVRAERLKKQIQLGLTSEKMTSAPTVGDWSKVENKPWEERNQEAFSAMIDRMDQGVGKIVDELHKDGQYDNTLIFYLHDNGGCAEENFNLHPAGAPKNLHKMRADELQLKKTPPMQTRDGRPVRSGVGVMAGPADTFLQVGEKWANISNTPFREYKHWVYEGGIATPMIVNWPAKIKQAAKGGTINSPSHLIDIMATCVDVAKAAYPKEYKGVEIQPMEGLTLKNSITDAEELKTDRMLFWEHESNRAVRDGKWKLVSSENKPWELYDIESDRAEQKNLAKDHPGEVQRLEKAWDKWAEHAKVLPLGAWKDQPAPKVKESTQVIWKLTGKEELDRENSPNIKNAGIDVDVSLGGPLTDGVIISQGGTREGYALFSRNNEITFSIVQNRKPESISYKLPDGLKAEKIRFVLGKDKQMELFINGKSVAKKTVKALFNDLPNDGVVVGNDYQTVVGDYPVNFEYKGDIQSVTINLLK